MSTAAESLPGPYAAAAQSYWSAGWRGVLPLPARKKNSPPKGWTGVDGAVPSSADIYAWAEGEEGNGNIALRLPRHVIGIDVDNYGGKNGAAELDRLTSTIGVELPSTWVSGSRHESGSGIAFYTVPPDLAWPGEMAPGIDVIQYRHRYAVVSPSVHPEGGTYRWRNPEGMIVVGVVPQVDELPALPEQWVTALTRGELAAEVRKVELTMHERVGWLAQHGGGEPCTEMQAATSRYVNELVAGGRSRHAAASDGTYRVCRMIAEGHPGGSVALQAIHIAFDAAFVAGVGREHDPNEWTRLIEGAVARSAVDEIAPVHPCDNPWAFAYENQDSPAARAAALAAQKLSTPVDSAAAKSPGQVDFSTPPEDWSEIVATPNVEPVAALDLDAALALERERGARHEYERQLANRTARRMLDSEEHARNFRIPPSVSTLREELALPDDPEEYLIADVWPVGGNVLLTAAFKSGKTTMVNNAVKSLADREPFLGKFDVALGRRIGVFNYEVSRNQYRRWLRQIDVLNPDRVSVLNLRDFTVPITVEAVQDWVVGWLIEHGIDTWIVDPFARAMVGSGDENSNVDVSAFLDTLDVIKGRAGVSELILVTHTGRAHHEIGKERSRGATRLDDWADVRWLLTVGDDDERYYRATGRDVDVPEGHLIYDGATRRMQYESGGRKERTGEKPLTVLVVDAVRNSSEGGLSSNDIVGVVNKNKKQTLAEINKLLEQHRLVRGADGKIREHDLSDLIAPSQSWGTSGQPETASSSSPGGSGVVPGGSGDQTADSGVVPASGSSPVPSGSERFQEVVSPEVPGTPFRGAGTVAPGNQDGLDDDENDGQAGGQPSVEPVGLKLPGDEEAIRIQTECIAGGGKPVWRNGKLVDLSTGETLIGGGEE